MFTVTIYMSPISNVYIAPTHADTQHIYTTYNAHACGGIGGGTPKSVYTNTPVIIIFKYIIHCMHIVTRRITAVSRRL